MTWIPVRAVALRASLAASLALGASLIPALARAARAYVSNEDDGTVTVTDTQRVAALAAVAVGKRPRGLVLSRDGASLYVALTGLPKCPPPIPGSSARNARGTRTPTAWRASIPRRSSRRGRRRGTPSPNGLGHAGTGSRCS